MAKWDPLFVELIRAAVHAPERARELVTLNPHALDLRTGIGETAMHYLAVENYVEAVKLLINLGADVNATINFGRTALEEALCIDAHEATEVLRAAGGIEKDTLESM